MREISDPRQQGVTLVEVLVTLVILAIGLLGLVGLQARLQILQLESYQRAQALMLLKDISGRIATNRNNPDAYIIAADAPLEAGNCPTDVSTRAAADIAEWCNALRGAGEVIGADNTRVGAMVAGRGCVEDVGPETGPRVFLVTVAWQGLAPISAPPASVGCGFGAYDGDADSTCVDDLCRRTVTTLVVIPELN